MKTGTTISVSGKLDELKELEEVQNTGIYNKTEKRSNGLLIGYVYLRIFLNILMLITRKRVC